MEEPGLNRGIERRWALAAFWAVGAAMTLLVFETVFQHPGYAWGDESDIVAAMQRAREGMPLRWMPGYGCLHKGLTLACMSLWPGKLWAVSVPSMAALAMEGFLLFSLARRWAGSRAGFFAVVIGLFSAFTLVRARACAGYALFPLEWLLLVWVRIKLDQPWQWVLWGVGLGLCCFDYEAWLPMAVLLWLFPLFIENTWRRRAWEAFGILLPLLALMPLGEWSQYFLRRRSASFLVEASPSAGTDGLLELFFGGENLAYFAPRGHGVFPLAGLLAIFGLGPWKKSPWLPLLPIGLGAALVLAGGAPYGLPSHRFIAAWPALVLCAGIGADALLKRPQVQAFKILFFAFMGLCAGYQLRIWQGSQATMDPLYHAPVRDLQRVAKAGLEESRLRGLPWLTELHPTRGAELRFLGGTENVIPLQGAGEVLAYLPWDYMPALRSSLQGRLFRERVNSAPAILAHLRGRDAEAAVETELAMRPLLRLDGFLSPAGARSSKRWLEEHPGGCPWARTVAQDYLGLCLFGNARVSVEWIESLEREALVSSRPLVTAALALRSADPAGALALTARARKVDPKDARALRLRHDLLLETGQTAEARRLEAEGQELYEKGMLLSE